MNRIRKGTRAPEQKNNSGNSVNSVQKTKHLVPLLLNWFAANARDLPWRRTRDPYAIWVSEIMLQQTQVKTVMPYWERWMRELPTIKSLAETSPEKIHKLWEGLGYYTRVRNMQKAAQVIEQTHGGKFPATFDDVLALPGIGRYTAGAICSIAFNQPTPILDGNVIRVLTRAFGISENPREKQTNTRLWQLAQDLVHHSSRITHHDSPCSHLNQSLMELGALICTPRQPCCSTCPVARDCIAHRQNRTEKYPNLGPRTAATARRFAAFIVEKNGRYLVRQRPGGVVNAHLWEFPNVEITGGVSSASRAARSALNFTPGKMELAFTVKHSITRYRITLEAFRVHHAGVSKMERGHRNPKTNDTGFPPVAENWFTFQQLQALAFSSAHKKILTVISDSHAD